MSDTPTASWFLRVGKYVLLALIVVVVIVIVIVLHIMRQKKMAEDLQRQLTIAKADADIQYLHARAATLTEQTIEVQTKKEAVKAEIKELEKKQVTARLEIEGMTNEEATAELARRGY